MAHHAEPGLAIVPQHRLLAGEPLVKIRSGSGHRQADSHNIRSEQQLERHDATPQLPCVRRAHGLLTLR
jgi:hypothetical protein